MVSKKNTGKLIAGGIGLFVLYKLFVKKEINPGTMQDRPEFNKYPQWETPNDKFGQVT